MSFWQHRVYYYEVNKFQNATSTFIYHLSGCIVVCHCMTLDIVLVLGCALVLGMPHYPHEPLKPRQTRDGPYPLGCKGHEYTTIFNHPFISTCRLPHSPLCKLSNDHSGHEPKIGTLGSEPKIWKMKPQCLRGTLFHQISSISIQESTPLSLKKQIFSLGPLNNLESENKAHGGVMVVWIPSCLNHDLDNA